MFFFCRQASASEKPKNRQEFIRCLLLLTNNALPRKIKFTNSAADTLKPYGAIKDVNFIVLVWLIGTFFW